MMHNEVRNAIKRALLVATTNDFMISFAPNFRTPLWKSIEDVRK